MKPVAILSTLPQSDMVSAERVPIIGDLGSKPQLDPQEDALVEFRGKAFSVVCKVSSNSVK